MIEQIDHIGIVVKDLEKAIKLYTEGLGLKLKGIMFYTEGSGKKFETFETIEHCEGFNTKLAFLSCGEVMIELLEPTGPGVFQDFLNERGEGLHHICYKVTNINETLESVGKMLELSDKTSRPGTDGNKIAVLNPQNLLNVEIEFVEKKY